MAYGIPEETIERIRSQADIVQIISEYVTLKRAGSRFRACCPFHKEKTPSFMVDPSKQLYHCFGCGAGGNVIGFLMRHEGFTFSEAVKHLGERMGIQIRQAQYAPGEQENRERLFDLYEFTTGFFNRCLLKSDQAEAARKYLEGRTLSGEAVKQFSIGYAPDGWDSLIMEASKKGFSKELLLQGGLARKSAEGRVYDAFRKRVMFPIWALSGKVVAFGGRTLEEGQPKYINSPETPIYQKGQTLYNLHRAKNSISNNGSVIVVEGYTDLIRLVLGGIDNCVASLGTALTQAQARLIKRYTDEVILVLDSDSAGEAAKLTGNGVFFGEDMKVRVARIPPPAKDPDEFLTKEGTEAFRNVLANAQDCIEYFADISLAKLKRPEYREEKVKYASIFLSLVERIPNPIRREEYFRLIASRLDIRPEILIETSQKNVSTVRIEEEARHFETRLKHEEKEYMWLVKLLIEKPECIVKVREHLDVAAIQSEPLRRLLDVVLASEEGRIDECAVFDRVQNEEAQQMLSKVMFEEMGSELLYPVEWWIGFIKGRQKKNKLNALSLEVAEAERAGDAGRVEQLLRRKTEISRDVEEIRRERARIPVDSAVEGGAGG
ncbi:DNA primase [Candidatus Poribacteria bacterium]|nr:DNA primase [Candidatus Poribacteria bacterium]